MRVLALALGFFAYGFGATLVAECVIFAYRNATRAHIPLESLTPEQQRDMRHASTRVSIGTGVIIGLVWVAVHLRGF